MLSIFSPFLLKIQKYSNIENPQTIDCFLHFHMEDSAGLEHQIMVLTQKFDAFQKFVQERFNILDEKLSQISQEIKQKQKGITDTDSEEDDHQCACCGSLSHDETKYCPGCGYYYCQHHWDTNDHIWGGNCNTELKPTWDKA